MTDAPFIHSLRVRYAETDQQGIVFNGHFPFYYNAALTELFRGIGWTRATFTQHGWDAVVAETTLRFRSPVLFDDIVDVQMPITHLGTTSLIIEPQFSVDGTLRVDGSVRHVVVSADTMRAMPIPEELRTDLAPLCVPPMTTNNGDRR